MLAVSQDINSRYQETPKLPKNDTLLQIFLYRFNLKYQANAACYVELKHETLQFVTRLEKQRTQVSLVFKTYI